MGGNQGKTINQYHWNIGRIKKSIEGFDSIDSYDKTPAWLEEHHIKSNRFTYNNLGWAFILACAQIASSELTGYRKAQKTSGVRATLEQKESDKRKTERFALQTTEAPALKEEIRNQVARRASVKRKILAGVSQGTERLTKRQMFGTSDEKLENQRFLFPEPREPNTSTREGQVCVANVDRTSGMVLAPYLDGDTVVSLGMLYGFTAGSPEGQFLIYENAGNLDNWKYSGDKKAVKATVDARREQFNKMKEKKPNMTPLDFSLGFRDRRYKAYTRSNKGLYRARQTLKKQVIQRSEEADEFAKAKQSAATTKLVRKRFKAPGAGRTVPKKKASSAEGDDEGDEYSEEVAPRPKVGDKRNLTDTEGKKKGKRKESGAKRRKRARLNKKAALNTQIY